MRISCSLGSLLSIKEVLKCAESISKTKIDTIWVPETWGMENFAMLSAISQKNNQQSIGSSIVNIFSRSPTSIAMGATTVDTLSEGRLILGLGTSSIPIVENFHGYAFERPVQRMREYVEIIRLVTSGKKINYSGKIFCLKDFTLLIKPYRESIPIYMAAINQKMVDLTWELGDGVIFYLRPRDEMKKTIEKMQAKKKIDVTCQIITSVSDDPELAINRAKRTLAFYISVGKIYRDFLANNGYQSETEEIFEEYKKTGFKTNYNLVTDSMMKQLCIAGEPEECKLQLRKFHNAGIDLPIVQFNPAGDTEESFSLFRKTFLEK